MVPHSLALAPQLPSLPHQVFQLQNPRSSLEASCFFLHDWLYQDGGHFTSMLVQKPPHLLSNNTALGSDGTRNETQIVKPV